MSLRPSKRLRRTLGTSGVDDDSASLDESLRNDLNFVPEASSVIVENCQQVCEDSSQSMDCHNHSYDLSQVCNIEELDGPNSAYEEDGKCCGSSSQSAGTYHLNDSCSMSGIEVQNVTCDDDQKSVNDLSQCGSDDLDSSFETSGIKVFEVLGEAKDDQKDSSQCHQSGDDCSPSETDGVDTIYLLNLQHIHDKSTSSLGSEDATSSQKQDSEGDISSQEEAKSPHLNLCVNSEDDIFNDDNPSELQRINHNATLSDDTIKDAQCQVLQNANVGLDSSHDTTEAEVSWEISTPVKGRNYLKNFSGFSEFISPVKKLFPDIKCDTSMDRDFEAESTSSEDSSVSACDSFSDVVDTEDILVEDLDDAIDYVDQESDCYICQESSLLECGDFNDPLLRASQLNHVKLYDGCELSVNEGILEVMDLYVANKLSKQGLKRSITTICKLLPEFHNLPTSSTKGSPTM